MAKQIAKAKDGHSYGEDGHTERWPSSMANGLAITRMAKLMMAIVKMAKLKHGPQILAMAICPSCSWLCLSILVMAIAMAILAIALFGHLRHGYG